MIKRLGFGLLLIVISCTFGCATNEEEGSYIGWYCSGDKRSDDWTCQQRTIKDGLPVDDSIAKTKAISAPSSQEGVDPEKEDLVVAGFPSQKWRQQLPTLTNTAVAIDVPGSESRRSNLKKLPPRQPEPVSRVSAYPVSANSEMHAIGEVVEENTETAIVASDKLLESDRAMPSSPSGFTVQLGAFRTESQLKSFIGENHLEDLSVSHVQTKSDDQVWHLLTWGEFETPVEALQAWEQQAVNYPKVEPWVRPLLSRQDGGERVES